MGSQRPIKRVNKPLEALKRQIADAAPALSRSELLDLADDIHDVIRRRNSEMLLDSWAETETSFKGWE